VGIFVRHHRKQDDRRNEQEDLEFVQSGGVIGWGGPSTRAKKRLSCAAPMKDTERAADVKAPQRLDPLAGAV
jgi:hypothetical protein